MRFTKVSVQEAEQVKRDSGRNPEWFAALVAGDMLLMDVRPSLSKVMTSTLFREGRVMRSKQHPEKQGFYVWLEQTTTASDEAPYPEDDEPPL